MKLTILGSGSPEANTRRASSGYLIEIGANKILFDCGGGVFDNLLRAGHMPSDITHIVFSHLHSDHMMDYARLVHAAWDEGGAPIKVFGPAPIAKISEGYFGSDGVLSHDLRARTELKPSQQVWVARGGSLPRPWPNPVVTEIAPQDMISGDGWSIRSCEVIHAQPFLMCLAFSISDGVSTLVYSGDAAYSPKFQEFCEGADLLLHWCYRLDNQVAEPDMMKLTPTPSEIAQTAEQAGVKQLLLTHFRVNMDEEMCHRSALDSARAEFSGDVKIAEDLDTFIL